MTDGVPALRRVAVFREAWLAGSETFIRNQANLLTRWQAHPIGMKKIDSPLAADTDRIVAPAGWRGRAARVLLRWCGRSRSLEDELRAIDPDVIHAHFGRDAMIVAPVARRLGIPLVLTLHGFDITSLPQAPGLRGILYRRRLSAVFDQAAAIIAVSAFIARQALRHGAPADRLTVSYIGIPAAPAAAGESSSDGPDGGIEPTRRVREILFLGRLVEKKGVADAIDALAGLPDEMRENLRLTIAGDGPLRPAIEAQAARTGVPTRFLGSVDAARTAELMAACDLFLAPSKRAADGDAEGFGMVFAEAAAAGLPVVSYRHGGVPEAVADGQTGILVPEGDVPALRAAVAGLLEDPARARALGQAGAQRVRAHFDCAVLTAALEDIYDAAADRR